MAAGERGFFVELELPGRKERSGRKKNVVWRQKEGESKNEEAENLTKLSARSCCRQNAIGCALQARDNTHFSRLFAFPFPTNFRSSTRPFLFFCYSFSLPPVFIVPTVCLDCHIAERGTLPLNRDRRVFASSEQKPGGK